MINAGDLIEKFRLALSEQWGYIWGKSGQIWTQAAQDKATDATIKQYGQKWVGRHVADCSGLFSWAFKQLGGYMYHGSNTMWRDYCTKKGPLKAGKRTDGEELLPGTAVFTGESEDVHGHVGLYVGGGFVIEAKGTQSGVVTSKITDKRWNWWGELKGVQYTQGDVPAEPAPPASDARPTIKKGSRGEYVTLLQTMLINRGYSVGSSGADGVFGTKTDQAVRTFQKAADLVVDGIVGPKTWAALDKVPEAPAATLYNVLINGLTKDQVTRLLKEFPTADVTEERS